RRSRSTATHCVACCGWPTRRCTPRRKPAATGCASTIPARRAPCARMTRALGQLLSKEPMETIDCAVIGAGVVGLAIARRLALAGREVVVLEAEPSIGNHTSSRNSEVIHAGIYYPTGSLRARTCLAGKQALYRYCPEHGVEHRRITKVIVATAEDEVPTLHKYKAQAERNGVLDLQWLNRDQMAALEPNVVAVAGLLSPSTGIIDSH